MAERRRVAQIAVASTLGAVAAVMRVNPIFDPDYFWHLATGALVVRTRVVPATDPFSHTFAGAPWRFVDWLADVLMFGLFRLGGDRLVVVAFALVGGLAVAVALALAVQRVRPTVALATGCLLLPAVVFRISPRPQTLTLLALVTLLAVLERAGRSPRALWAAPALIALWQNVHSSAILGWLVLVGHAAGTALEVRAGRADPSARRQGLLATAAGFVALFCAVRPLDRLVAGFDHVGDRNVALLFDEWAPVWALRGFYAAVPAFAVLLFGVVAAACTARGRAALGFDRILPAFGLAALGVVTMRFLPLAALALAPLFARAVEEGLAAERPRAWLALPAVLGLALLAYKPRPIGFGLARGDFPVDAGAFVAREHPSGKLYNDFHYGGWVMWELGVPVFVDGRSMAVYGVGFVLSLATANDERFGELLDQHQVGWALAPTHQRTGWFQRRPGWALVYFDDVAFVAVRVRDNPALAEKHAYRAIDVARWQEAIPTLRDKPWLATLARTEAQRAIAAAKTASLPWVLLASVEIARGDGPAADAAIEEALRRDPGSARAHRAKLIRCQEKSDLTCTCAEVQAVLAVTPKNAYALATRNQAGCP